MATSADVPDKYDVVINGIGYMVDSSFDDTPFRTPPAQYSFTPTFLERTNISGAYGDNTQDFYLTASQDDWSGGQGQQFFRGNDNQSKSMFYLASSLQIGVPGQVTIGPKSGTTSNGSNNTIAACGGGFFQASTHYFIQSDSHLYSWTGSPLGGGASTDLGAHGAGTGQQWGVCTDGTYIYISGSSKVRKYSAAPAFTDFSATPCGPIAYLNNALYGYTAGQLVVYSTGGTQSVIYTWKDATGTALAPTGVKLVPFGSTMLILFPVLNDCPEIWQHDGTNTFKIAELPQSVIAYDMLEVEGVVFIGAVLQDSLGASVQGATPVLYAYTNGSINQIWKASSGTPTAFGSTPQPALGTYGGRLIFLDGTVFGIMQLDLTNGSVTNIGSFANDGSGSQPPYQISSVRASVMISAGAGGASTTTLTAVPNSSNLAASGILTTSLIDFDNALTKQMRSVKVDWSGGGSVNVAYQIDSLTGSYTNLQTGAVSGTEYLLPANTTGHSISIQVTLINSAGNFPTLKRIYVRAAPVLQSYRMNIYLLDCTGNKMAPQPGYVRLVNGAEHNLDGQELITALDTAISAGVVSITDRFGTFNGIIEPGATTFREVRSDYGRGEYRAEVHVREV